MWAVKGIANKLKAVFFGPGWFPGTPRLGNLEDLPEVPSIHIVMDVYLILLYSDGRENKVLQTIGDTNANLRYGPFSNPLPGLQCPGIKL